MAHPEQLQFCLGVKERFPKFFKGVRVLEIGAQNVNGSMRPEFENCEYIGVDVVDGEGVDVVCYGHEFQGDCGSFDVAFSCETFEHDPHASKTVSRMLDLLRPGGLFFMTCAGTGRAEHGTTKTGDVRGPNTDHYKNITMRSFLAMRSVCDFDVIYIERNATIKDLYFWGIKAQ